MERGEEGERRRQPFIKNNPTRYVFEEGGREGEKGSWGGGGEGVRERGILPRNRSSVWMKKEGERRSSV